MQYGHRSLFCGVTMLSCLVWISILGNRGRGEKVREVFLAKTSSKSDINNSSIQSILMRINCSLSFHECSGGPPRVCLPISSTCPHPCKSWDRQPSWIFVLPLTVSRWRIGGQRDRPHICWLRWQRGRRCEEAATSDASVNAGQDWVLWPCSALRDREDWWVRRWWNFKGLT